MALSHELIQQRMKEATHHYKMGQLKTSYDLYIEALHSALIEFKQLKFIDENIVTDHNMAPLFILASQCLGHIKDISSYQHKKTPPPIPVKPSSLSSTHPPPLPSRPQIIDSPFSVDNSLKIITNKNRTSHHSITSSLSVPASPTSPHTANPLNVVKTLLSIVPHSDGKKSACPLESRSDQDDLFLLTNSTINPLVLLPAQTSHSDTLSHSSTSEYLPVIPQAPLITAYQSLQLKLDEEERLLSASKKATNDHLQQMHQTKIADIKSTLNRVRNIHMSATTVPTILQFNPVLIAYQLTLIDSTLFRNIPIQAILTHTTKTPHEAIVASTDFFNYLTRLIEHTILLQQEASGRAEQINHWIKVAGKCHELKNYQTLKAVISALGTPPIQRLKRSWSFVPKKTMLLLDDLGELMSEASNYGKYRERLGIMADLSVEEQQAIVQQRKNTPRKNSFGEPTVPFLGLFIHDMTYLNALQKNHWIEKDSIQHDTRVQELLRLVKNLQRSPPYSPHLSAFCVKDFNKQRKRKLSHALSRSSVNKKTHHLLNEDETGELSMEMQQCLVTQYLLTRSWVSEKTVDELSQIREPTKSARSYSVTESLPPLIPSLSSGLRDSSGSLSASVSSSDNSRPISLEDDSETQQEDDKKSAFWIFSKRKSIDQGYMKDSYNPIQRTNRHFSLTDVNNTPKSFNPKKKESGLSVEITHTVKMQREGSMPSIFRKDFWKSSNTERRQPLISFHSDQTLMTTSPMKESYTTTTFDHPIHYKYTQLHPLDSSALLQQ
ncbi:ras guanine nucleotide exchange factor domain-containing protein [Pilobolus umbonatus]|nr:ras guanine nucleotide exchange factor domain-containing protein [Pilobolus umbonatus]